MKKQIKLLITAVLLLITAYVMPVTVLAAEGDVVIDENNFPDATFRNHVKGYDSNNDGYLSLTERSNITNINVSNSNITSLKGVEYFPDLYKLWCNGNKLTSLDLSKNEKLGVVFCYDNQLTSLNMGVKPQLYQISCQNNKLTALDITKCTNLKYFYCYSNQITDLNVTNCPRLYEFNAKDNLLTGVDVSKNPELHNLCLIRNNITSLDVSNNTKVQYLYLRGNKLTNIDVSKNTILKKLWVDSNQITCLDISKNAEIVEVLTNDNTYTISQTRDNTFDLSTISGFNTSFASNWSGGSVSGNILTINVAANTVTYIYDIDGASGSKTAELKLNISNPSKAITYIDNVTVTGVDTPVAGNSFDTTASCETAGVNETSPSVVWEKKNGNTYQKVTGKADYNTTYRAIITVTPDWWYEFKNDTKGTVNGKTASVSYDATSRKFVLSVEYTTAKEKLLSIEQNNSIEVEAGVELKEMKFPTTVSITTDGKKTKSAKVNWNISKPTYVDGTSFDIENKDGYSFVLQGVVTCPENVDAGDIKLISQIKVSVAKDGVEIKPIETIEETESETQEETVEETVEETEEISTEEATVEETESETQEPTEKEIVEETSTNSNEDNEEDNGNFWWLWIIILVIIIVVLIIIILKKRKKDEEQA